MKQPYHTKEITITSHLVYNNKFFQLHYVGLDHISVISLVGGLLVQAEWHSVVVASSVCHGATPVDGVLGYTGVLLLLLCIQCLALLWV